MADAAKAQWKLADTPSCKRGLTKFMSLRGIGSTLGTWKFSKLLGSKFMLVFLMP